MRSAEHGWDYFHGLANVMRSELNPGGMLREHDRGRLPDGTPAASYHNCQWMLFK
jgi:hypothetical protein